MKEHRTHKLSQPEMQDALEQLSLDGVHVASGPGTVWQILTVSVVLVLALYLAISQSLADPLFLLLLVPVLVAIDFMSGFVHWFFDTQVEPSRSWMGRIAIDFLDHHVHPGRTAEVGFFTSAWRPALIISTPLISFSVLAPVPMWLTATVFWTGFLSMLVPQTHKEAHLGKRPAPIAALQTLRLIVHPLSHRAHHEDNRESFCVFTGWLNPLLDRIRFWRGLEWLFATVRGG